MENLDGELKRYRARPFLEESFEGVRRFNRELVDLLKRGDSYSEREILAKLNIDPGDVDLVKAVSRQLEIWRVMALLSIWGGARSGGAKPKTS